LPPTAAEIGKGFSLHLLSRESDGEIWISD
jgi:hypothetical protein